MFKINGFDELPGELDVTQKALAELDGELGTVSFGPSDPGSIEAVISHVATIG